MLTPFRAKPSAAALVPAGMVALLFVPVVVIWSTTTGGSERTEVDAMGPDIPQPVVSILERAPRSGDVLPADVATVLGDELADPTNVRLALESEGRQVFVASGKGADRICLITLDGPGGAVGIACGRASTLASEGPIMMSLSSTEGDRPLVTGIVTDDVKSVTAGAARATMGENVFLFHGPTAGAALQLVTERGTQPVSPPPDRPPEGGNDGGVILESGEGGS